MSRTRTEAPLSQQQGHVAQVDLVVSGMTCGSCAARVEKALSRQDGVEQAGVNFATERATVVFDPARTQVEALVAAVGKMGYGLAPDEHRAEGEQDEGEAGEVLEQMWLRRVLLAWPLGLVVLVLSMFYMGSTWAGWGSFLLTIPVQFWAGYPFLHQAAARSVACWPWPTRSRTRPLPPSPTLLPWASRSGAEPHQREEEDG